MRASPVRANRITASLISGRKVSAGEFYGTPWLFDFTNNGQPLTALPAILTALNAAYTRNSLKKVVQNGALVSLSANQFGTSYDPVAGAYGYVPEPAATNLATNSDGNAATYTVSNVTDGTAVPGFTNGIAFGDNSVQRSATKAISVTSGTTYSISFFIIMDDGNAPVVGTTNILGDFSITCNAVIATTKLERVIGSSVYRVSASIAAAATSSQPLGCTKYTGQSARTFRVTGIQVETGLRATSYIATTGSTASRSADVLTVPLWINNTKYSQDGSTGNWTRGNSSVTTSGTAPDGTATAQLVTATASGVVTLYANGIKAPAATVTYSVYVKQGNKATCPLLLRNATTATNFTQGTLTFATGAITGAGWTVTNEGNGWFRCKCTQSTGITVGDTLSAFIGFAGSGTDVLSDTVYFWGAQIEPGSVATTYRPTVNNLEYARNLLGYSQAFDDAYWTKGASGTVSADTTSAPDGTTTADKYIPSTGNSSHNIDKASLTISGAVTVSVYVKPAGYSWVYVGILGATNKGSYFNVSAGAVGSAYNTAPDSVAITPVGDGWYRCSITAVSASATTLRIGAASSDLGNVFVGDGTSGIYVWGAQLEAGSTASAYEPTNIATPSANANTTGYNSAGYTLAVDQRMDTTLVASVVSAELSDLTSSNRALISASSGVTATVSNTSGGSGNASISLGSLGLTRSKYAGSYQVNNILGAKAGVAGTADTSAALAAAPLMFHIGAAYNGSLQYNGFIFGAKLVTMPTTQAQTNGLTT